MKQESKSEYDLQSEKFLKDTNTSMTIKFLKYGKHFIDERTEDYRDIYEVTLTRGDRIYTFNFGQSIAHSGRYTYYSSSKGKIVSNDKTQLNKLVGRAISIGECRVNEGQAEPTAYHILSSLTKENPISFTIFCDNYGYDIDSIKAHKIYDAVLDEWEHIQMLYDDEELEQLREIQ